MSGPPPLPPHSPRPRESDPEPPETARNRLPSPERDEGGLEPPAEIASLLGQVVDVHPTPLVLTTSDGDIRYANHNACALFGYGTDELTGQPMELLMSRRHHDDQAHRRRRLLASSQTQMFGQPNLLEARHRDGHEIPVEVTMIPIESSSGTNIACVIVDCTERSRVWAALGNSEKRLSDIIDNTSSVVYVKDLQGKYLLINSKFESLFHVTRDEVHGRSDFDIFPAEMAQAFRVNDVHVARSGEVLKIDEVAPHDDGPHTYLSVKFPLRDEQGGVYAIGGISTDITDRVRAENAVEGLRNRLELILNSINNGIVGLDADGEVTFVNPTAERLLKADASGIASLLPAMAMDLANQKLSSPEADVIDEESAIPVRLETALQRSDGRSFPAELEVHQVIEDEESHGAVIVIRDITDRKRREEIELELQSAWTVQQILYPRDWPTFPGFDIAGHVYPAESMCGDYLDFIRTGEHAVTIAVGDVSGHGFGPSLQMVETRSCLRAMLKTGIPLAESVTQLNQLLVQDTPSSSFISLIAAAIDIETRTLTYVSAGHPGWVLRPGSEPRVLIPDGLVLGIDSSRDYEVAEPIHFASGDILLLPTDGVQETLNAENDLFGIDRMLASVSSHADRPAAEIVDRLYQATLEFAGSRHQSDDVTIAVIKVL